MRQCSKKSEDERVSVVLTPFVCPKEDAHGVSTLNAGKGVDLCDTLYHLMA